jgi:YfiH family protein
VTAGHFTEPAVIIPQWPAPPSVRCCFTTRGGGASLAPWQSFNLADHVGDAPEAVRQNRARLLQRTGLDHEPGWLQQVHGTQVRRLSKRPLPGAGDAAITRELGRACVVMVADCVPILLCARDGREVAAVHAGWKGLAANVIAHTVAAFTCEARHLLAWIGPCISAPAYEVGQDLYAHLSATDAVGRECFTRCGVHWHLDLRLAAKQQLARLGVTAVTVSPHCVHAEQETFFSYRRDGCTGRMAALIWIDSNATALG